MAKFIRIAILLVVDILIINIAYIASLLLRFDFEIEHPQFIFWLTVYAENILPITLIIVGTFAACGLYTSMWRYAGTEELFKIVLAATISTFLVMAYFHITSQDSPRTMHIGSFVLIVALISTSRLSYRFLRNFKNHGAFKNFSFSIGNRDIFGGEVTKVMIIGAGDAGATIIKEIRNHPEYKKRVVVAVDDDQSKIGHRIMGVKIAGNQKKIKSLVRKYSVGEIIVAIPSANQKTIQGILNECNRTSCKIKILPGLIDLINDKVSISKLRDVAIEDLLGRDAVELDNKEISIYLEGKIVMVTGGGGSIGSELCRQIAKFRPRRLIAFDIYENTVFELANEMKTRFPELEFEAAIGSVRSAERLEQVFQKYKPHVIFHAAAHKHVPLMERHPKEAILNNILGTKNMIDVADRHAVERFVMISTDKAVNPANVMGATKRVAEMILQEKSNTSNTIYSAVRFGNVLGRNGAVIPIFRRQIEAGGPVTVTHEEITRYFMTIPEAVQLVIQTGAMARGGEIFVLDMGEPIKIMELAENVVKLSGYTPGVDIDITITGLRPGEKLYEELLLDGEEIEKTEHDKIHVGHPLRANAKLKEMLQTDECDNGKMFEDKIKTVMDMTDFEVKAWLKELVPNYTPED